MKVSWHDCSQYMEKMRNCPNHQRVLLDFPENGGLSNGKIKLMKNNLQLSRLLTIEPNHGKHWETLGNIEYPDVQ